MEMYLYLIRHGEADAAPKAEMEPGLTVAGEAKVARMAEHVCSLGLKPEVLFCSPLLRAQQTSKFFADPWELKVQTAPWLCPAISPSQVLSELKQCAEENIALVGHLPCLGLLLGTIVWGLPPKEVVIPKAGVALIHIPSWDPGTAKLKWMLAPDSLLIIDQ